MAAFPGHGKRRDTARSIIAIKARRWRAPFNQSAPHNRELFRRDAHLRVLRGATFLRARTTSGPVARRTTTG